jgi:hypothetical protein
MSNQKWTPKPDETFWRLEVNIHPGKLEAFQALVREQIESAKNEEGTLQYEWYFNADNTVSHTYERYRDSEAIVAHASIFGSKFAERVLQVCDPVKLEVYGSPNDEAKGLLNAYNPSNYFTNYTY